MCTDISQMAHIHGYPLINISLKRLKVCVISHNVLIVYVIV
jgi:hypothetical protein